MLNDILGNVEAKWQERKSFVWMVMMILIGLSMILSTWLAAFGVYNFGVPLIFYWLFGCGVFGVRKVK